MAASEPAQAVAATPDPVARVAVTVNFLHMQRPPARAGVPLPADAAVLRLPAPTVPFYRYLYNTVGQQHLWWLRRAQSDTQIARLLAMPEVSIHVLYRQHAPAGFYELERREGACVNLGYFGLLPHAVGQRLGSAFLRHAIDTAWAGGATRLTVNTCTADNPRALPGYLAAGFTLLRQTREVWNIPVRLGLAIPVHWRT